MPESGPLDLAVRGGTLLTPSGAVRADVGVRGERVAAVGDVPAGRAAEEVDARGLHVLPGVIDTQVHFREPGGEQKEDLATGGLAAVLGGVTTVFEMPNTDPPTTTPEALGDKLERARGRMACDHAFYLGATADNAPRLAEWERLPGCAGVKVFMGSSTGGLLVASDAEVGHVLGSGRRRVAVHAEDEDRLRERRGLAERAGHPRAHPEWRDAETALRATRRLMRLARAAERPVHVLHVSTADELPVLRANEDLATVETTPQHLTLEAPECYERLGTFAQMNPPLRDASHKEALWEALRDGTVDVLGSDHAPHTREEKGGRYPDTPSGMPGVQTLLPVMLEHVHEGRLTLERLVDLTSAGPARVFGIAGKGRLAVGYDADLVLVDLGAVRRITNEWIASRCGWTPFDGVDVHGWPVTTIVRGHVAVRDGAPTGPPRGRPVRFRV